MEKGSMIVLAIMATLILSLILAAGLSVSTTEAVTTQNFLLNKVSYYKAVEGVEIIAEEIRSNPNPDNIVAIQVQPGDYPTAEGAAKKKFITGLLTDLQAGSTQTVKMFDGFDPPPLPSMGLGSMSGIQPVIWYVPVTSEVKVGSKSAYTEIEAGIYSIIMTGY